MTAKKTDFQKMMDRLAEANALASKLKLNDKDFRSYYSCRFVDGQPVEIEFSCTKLNPSESDIHNLQLDFPAMKTGSEDDMVGMDMDSIAENRPLPVTHPGYDPEKGAEEIEGRPPSDQKAAAARKVGVTSTER